MVKYDTMTRFLVAILASTILCGASMAAAAELRTSKVSLSISVGFDGHYRAGAAWAPVRVDLRNQGTDPIDGVLSAQGAADMPRAGVYNQHVLLPPLTRKRVTIYVPGVDIQGTVDVRFTDVSGTLASGAAYPNVLGDTDLVVGSISGDPESAAWLRAVTPSHSRLRQVPLSAETIDPQPDVLATFDVIILTNTDTSRLDTGQTFALERYVRNGGTLILVGGPNWQQTLGGLPEPLVPGRLVGTRTLPDLRALGRLQFGTPPAHQTSVSVLAGVRGAVIATEAGIPLVVKAGLGNGQIEYLAFDPANTPIAGWSSSARLLTGLVAGAAPLSMRRVVLLPVDRANSFLDPGPGPIDMASQLSNVNAPTLPAIFTARMIAVLAALLAGAVGVVAARRFRRRITWLGVPIAAVLVGTLILDSVPTLARRASVVNTLNVVYMDSPNSQRPANRYIGVMSALAGRYGVSNDAPALARDVFPSSALTYDSQNAPPGIFGEGARTLISVADSGTAIRGVALRTSVRIAGDIETNLHLDSSGNIVGRVTNRTRLTLQRPALLAGQSYALLPAISPGGHAAVHMRPRADVRSHDYRLLLAEVYGTVIPNYRARAQRSVFGFRGPALGLPTESTFDQRVRNAVNALPDSHLISIVGEVTLVSWTDQPLNDVSLVGGDSRHRDLTLLVKPVSVGVLSGAFELPTGVLGARPTEVIPATPEYPCCGPSVQPISLGAGGAATFAFDLPATRHLHFRHLFLDVYAGGADPTASGYSKMVDGATSVYDWRRSRWVGLHFSHGEATLLHADRFVSHTGAMLVRITASRRSGDLTILDSHADLQLQGSGFVR